MFLTELLKESASTKIKIMKSKEEKERFMRQMKKAGEIRYKALQDYLETLRNLGYEDMIDRDILSDRAHKNFTCVYQECMLHMDYNDWFKFDYYSSAVRDYLISLTVYVNEVYSSLNSNMMLSWPSQILNKLVVGETTKEWWAICCGIDHFSRSQFYKMADELTCCSYIDNNYNKLFRNRSVGLLYNFSNKIVAMYNGDLNSELVPVRYTRSDVPDDLLTNYRYRYIPIVDTENKDLFVKCFTSEVELANGIINSRFCHRVLPIELMQRSNQEEFISESTARNEILIYKDPYPYGIIYKGNYEDLGTDIWKKLSTYSVPVKMFRINEDNSVTRIK